MSRRWLPSSSNLTSWTAGLTLPPIHIRNFPANTKPRSVSIITKSGISDESFTPRPREYFPITLLWQLKLTTNKKGHVHLDFKLADNTAARKMSAIGSNESVEVGTLVIEIRATQPFFAEFDPQRVLTKGDRLSLPVVLRNYPDHKQTVDVELRPKSWFTLLAGNRSTEMNPGDFSKWPFGLVHQSPQGPKPMVST